MAAADVAKLIASLELKDNFTPGANRAMASLGKLESTSFRVGQNIGKGINNAARNIAKIGLVATGVGIGVVAQAVRSASDLNETVSKVGVVFGSASEDVLKFGDTAAASLGLSKNAALAAAATYGNLFVSMGLTADKSADMSKKLVTLAGDLASFNNIDPTEATEKLRAGLTGESEPLKSLGININETIIKAKALELGLVKTSVSTADLKLKTIALKDAQKAHAEAVKKYGANSEQALKATVAQEKAQTALESSTKKIPATLDAATKAQAAYALILEQSKTAQGDFSRTSSGLANQQRILKANFENISATLGQALLPSVAKAFAKVNDFVVKSQPAIKALGEQLPAIFDKAVAFAENVPWDQVASGLQAASFFAGKLFDLFVHLPPQVQGTIIALAGLNKLTGGAVGGIVSELGKGLIKGVLGMNAGVVNINAAAVNGGVPIPSGGTGILSKALSFVGPALLVTGTVALATEVSGLLDPTHRTPSGDIFRGTNVIADQIANLQRSNEALAARAASGDEFAARQLQSGLKELARLQKAQAEGLTNIFDIERTHLGKIADDLIKPQTFSLSGKAQDDIATAVAIGTERGIVHSGVFKKAQAIREAGGFRLSRDALIAELHGKQPLGTSALISAEAIALASGNKLRNDPNAKNLASAVTNLALLQRTQSHLPADLAAKLDPKIHSLEAAIKAAQPIVNVTVNISASNVTQSIVRRLRIAKNNNPRTTQTGPLVAG